MLRRVPSCVPLGLSLLVLAVAGCGGSEDTGAPAPGTSTAAAEGVSAPLCPPAWKPGWQQLADRIEATVYCPSWLPDPLTGEIGGPWQGVHSVRKDGSYLMSFIWFERGAGEVHVNLRGYPGQTGIPTCDGKPCFSDLAGNREAGGREVEVYTVNRGADTWHVLYAWREQGALYALSQHVVPDLGLSYGRVVENLDRMMRGLVEIEPTTA